LFGPTKFVGYDQLEVRYTKYALDGNQLYLEVSPFYAEMGGQVGDSGYVETKDGKRVPVINTLKGSGGVFVHKVGRPDELNVPNDFPTRFVVDIPRRHAIERHHTVTHILHWALHEIVSRDATQKGSYVGPDKLTFDFSSAALTPQQKRDVEKLVNEQIKENAPVSWTEIPYAEAKKRADIQQFFGDKYGDVVRVVQIGGDAKALNGYSMELCGGTHVRTTGEIESFRIVREEAIAAGIRRIEAVSGEAARQWTKEEAERQQKKFEMLARKKSDVAALPDGVRLQMKDGTSHDFGILVAADGLASSARNVVFPEYPKPHFTGLIGTGGITDAPVPDTGGVMRMTFGNNAFFGYLKSQRAAHLLVQPMPPAPAKTEKSPIPAAMQRRSWRCMRTIRAPTPRSSNMSTGSSAAIRSTMCPSFPAGTEAGLR